uniref:Ubiquitin-like protease family profile domain-containing protein n=1 Tax=Glossina brevipalpis TaxID=37001 RepID=A0A1A9WW24_9MUSC
MDLDDIHVIDFASYSFRRVVLGFPKCEKMNQAEILVQNEDFIYLIVFLNQEGSVLRRENCLTATDSGKANFNALKNKVNGRDLNPLNPLNLVLDSLTVPICTGKHWPQAIICNPNLNKEKIRQIPEMDSMKQTGVERVAGNQRKFLESAYRHRGAPEMRITAEVLRFTVVHVPQQENKTDCGVFVLQNTLHYLIHKSAVCDAAYHLVMVGVSRKKPSIPSGRWLTRSKSSPGIEGTLTVFRPWDI